MEKSELHKHIKNGALIFFGCVIYSAGVAFFLDPNGIASGGVTGISIIIDYVTNRTIGTGWIILIINVPLIVLGIVRFGKRFMLSSALATALSSGLIELFDLLVVPHMPKMQNLLVPAIVGGVLFGGGLGLIFRAGGSTCGTDIIVKLLRKKFRHLKTGVISMSIDVCIIMASAFVYKDAELLCVTIISVVLFTIAFDRMLYGGNSAMLVYIITTEDKAKPICDGILSELDIGATIVDGKGAYSGDGKTVIMCAVKNYVYPRLRDLIGKHDSDAFTIVSSAKEIYGEGYKPHGAEEL